MRIKLTNKTMAKLFGFDLPRFSRAKDDSAVVGRETSEDIEAASQEVLDDLYAEQAEAGVDALIAEDPEWAAATEEVEAEKAGTVEEIAETGEDKAA